MPQTEVKFFRDESDRAPALDWLADLPKKQSKGFAKCMALLEKLAQSGHELQFPAASILRNGIYELRAHDGTVQYRLLYFFDQRQRNVAIVARGFAKENKKQQDTEIARAYSCKVAFDGDPDKHIYSERVTL